MAKWKRLVATLLLLLLSAGFATAQTEQRVALVLGNGSYESVGKLRNPRNDATAIAALLRHVGFDVVEREDATRRTMIQAIRSFSEKLSPGGIGLLYYAGHGIQAQGANYLVPVDAKLSVEDDLKYETLDLQDILNKLDEARVRLSIVILDACRDNPFRSFRSSTNGLAMINPPAGTVIAYATAPGKVASDGNEEHSIFTAELLKAMNQPDKLLDVLEHVTDAVERRTGNAQTPWINSSFRGDFYFTGPATVTITSPPEASASATSSEIVFWQSIAKSSNRADFEAYLRQYPQGSFAALALNRLASLATRPAVPDARPADAKNPKTSGTAAKPIASDPPVSRKQPPAEPASAVATAPAQPPPHAPPALPAPRLVVADATPQPPKPAQAAPPERLGAASAPLIQGQPVQPAQEATVRPPQAATAQSVPPDTAQPTPAAAAPPRSVQRCFVPHATGLETGAGGYIMIRVVNTGGRCGSRVTNPYQPTEFTLSLSKPPGHGSVTIEGNRYYYTPSPGFAGSDEFSIVMSPYGHFRAAVTVLPPQTQQP